MGNDQDGRAKVMDGIFFFYFFSFAGVFNLLLANLQNFFIQLKKKISEMILYCEGNKVKYCKGMSLINHILSCFINQTEPTIESIAYDTEDDNFDPRPK